MELSKKNDKKDISSAQKQLQSLGLSEKESAVYVALLPHRDIGTSKIIRATGLHGQFVYQALAKLEDVGLVRHVVQSGRKKFTANDPNRLLALAEEKKLTARSVAKQLEMLYTGAREQSFQVFQGESAFSAHEFSLLEEAGEVEEIAVIGGSGDRFVELLGSDYEEYERIRLLKNIPVRYIGAEAQRETLGQMSDKRKLFSFRVFPGLSTGLVNTNIRSGSITLNIFGNPILVFKLSSKEVAESYRQFFDGLWGQSE